MLQAGQQTKQTEADEGHAPAALPHIAGYNEENPEHSPGPARGAEEPPPPGMGDSPTILLMDELAAARPPRKPVAPLLASFDKLVNEAENIHVFIKTNLITAMKTALYAVDWAANTNIPTHWTGLVNCAAETLMTACNEARDQWSQAMDKPPLRLFQDAQQWLGREKDKQQQAAILLEPTIVPTALRLRFQNELVGCFLRTVTRWRQFDPKAQEPVAEEDSTAWWGEDYAGWWEEEGETGAERPWPDVPYSEPYSESYPTDNDSMTGSQASDILSPRSAKASFFTPPKANPLAPPTDENMMLLMSGQAIKDKMPLSMLEAGEIIKRDPTRPIDPSRTLEEVFLLCYPAVPMAEVKALLRHVTMPNRQGAEKEFEDLWKNLTDPVIGTSWEHRENLKRLLADSKTNSHKQGHMHSKKESCDACNGKAFQCRHTEESPDGLTKCGERLIRLSVSEDFQDKPNKAVQWVFAFATCSGKITKDKTGRWTGHYSAEWVPVMLCIMEHIQNIKTERQQRGHSQNQQTFAVVEYLDSHARFVSMALRFHILRAVWYYATKVARIVPSQKPATVAAQKQMTLGLDAMLAPSNVRNVRQQLDTPPQAGSSKSPQTGSS